MKHSRRAALAVGIAAAVVAGAAARAVPLRLQKTGERSTITLSVVATNDVHGGLVPRDGPGGVALFAGFLANLRAARATDGAVLLVDAGDMFQGTLESNLGEGDSVVAAYNALGYAAAAIGNHEFDFGVIGPRVAPAGPNEDPRGALKARAEEASFPFLAANLIDRATRQPVTWANVRPSVVIERAGVRIGLVGVMTAEALLGTIAAATGGLEVAPLAPVITREAAALRQSGVDVLMVIAHAGGRCGRFDDAADLSSCDMTDAEIIDVVRELPPGTVDLVASGHTHAGMAHVVNGTIVMQAFSGGTAFSRADIVLDASTRQIRSKRVYPPRDICGVVYQGTLRCDGSAARGRPLVPALYEGKPVRADDTVGGVIAPALERARPLKDRPLDVLLKTAVRRELIGTESPLGNLFADGMLAAVPGAQVAINNTRGGLRADLAAGPLTYGRFYEVFPFDNLLVRLRLTGAELVRVFRARLTGSGELLGIAGLRVRASCANGDVAVALEWPSGRPIAMTDQLDVVTTDFLSTGGGGILTPVMPPGGFSGDEDLPLAREAVAEWLQRRGGTLTENQLVDRKTPRWQVSGRLPLPCK